MYTALILLLGIVVGAVLGVLTLAFLFITAVFCAENEIRQNFGCRKLSFMEWARRSKPNS